MSDYFDIREASQENARQRDEFRYRNAVERDEAWREETRRQCEDQAKRHAIHLEAIERNTTALERIVAILEDILVEAKP